MLKLQVLSEDIRHFQLLFTTQNVFPSDAQNTSDGYIVVITEVMNQREEE
jgi:hypothetical protein